MRRLIGNGYVLGGVLWISYEVMTLKNVIDFFRVTAQFGFTGQSYLTYFSRQVVLNPVVREIDSVFPVFDRCLGSFAGGAINGGVASSLGIFLYQTLNVIVVDILAGGVFWFVFPALLVALLRRLWSARNKSRCGAQ